MGKTDFHHPSYCVYVKSITLKADIELLYVHGAIILARVGSCHSKTHVDLEGTKSNRMLYMVT